MQVRDLVSMLRVISTKALALGVKPSPILCTRRGNKSIYVASLSTYLLSGERDLIVLFCKTDGEPKKYIRYVDAPREFFEMRDNTKNPMGIYIPVLTIDNIPKILDPNVKEIHFKSFNGGEIFISDEVPSVGRNYLNMIMLNDINFMRLVLERKETLGIVFSIKYRENDSNHILFALGEPIRVNTKFYGRIYCTIRKEVAKPFLSIDERGKIIEAAGREEAGLPYASVIEIVDMSQSFKEILFSFVQQYIS